MNAGDQVVLAMGEGQARIVREAVATGMMTGGVLIAPVSPPGAARVLMSNAMQLAAEGASLAGDFGHVSSESIVAMFKAAAAVRGEGKP